MNFEEFRNLFIEALNIAANNAERELTRKIPRQYEILLYGAGCKGDILSVDATAKQIFIDEDNFYRIIDVAIQAIKPNISRVFVRVSDHKPVPLDQTWNTPKGSGPFKQIIAQIQIFDG